MLATFFRYEGDFLKVLNRSPTSQIGHQHRKLVTNTFGLQHIWSPTSVTNIDITHTRYTMLFSKNLDPHVILRVSEMESEMEPVKIR